MAVPVVAVPMVIVPVVVVPMVIVSVVIVPVVIVLVVIVCMLIVFFNHESGMHLEEESVTTTYGIIENSHPGGTCATEKGGLMRHVLILLVLFAFGCNGQVPPGSSKTSAQTLEDSKSGEGVVEDRLALLVARPVPPLGSKSPLQDEDYRSVLTPQEFHILRDKGTERAFSGEYNASKAQGVFHCRACNAPLFESSTKFDSRTGWPSFYDAVKGRVLTQDDTSMGMTRQEIVCSHCGGHLGHVFEDGPEPTGLRYCVNSLSIVLDTE